MHIFRYILIYVYALVDPHHWGVFVDSCRHMFANSIHCRHHVLIYNTTVNLTVYSYTRLRQRIGDTVAGATIQSATRVAGE